MSLLQAIILGIIQGLTEFLPVSSSAHLVLAPYFLGWQIPADQAFIFNVLVQNGTLLAVIVYFWRDLAAIIAAFVRGLLRGKPFEDANARMGWYLILATIPAGLFGLAAKDLIESAFSSAVMTAVFLVVTAALLLLVERVGKRTRPLSDLNWKDALVIGVFQALSVFPGVSRSGSTIAGGMLRNFERPSAARFAFLMSIPVMLAAGLLETVSLTQSPDVGKLLPVVAVGFVTAAVVGYFAIRWLIGYLMRHSLKVFAFYCLALAAVTLVVTLVRS